MLEREEEWTGNMRAQGRNVGEGRRMDREYEGSFRNAGEGRRMDREYEGSW